MRRILLPCACLACIAAGSLSYMTRADGAGQPDRFCARGACLTASQWSGRSWHWFVRATGERQGRLAAERRARMLERRLRRMRHDLRRIQARRVMRVMREAPQNDWRAKQIAAAEKIGQGGDAGGTDPWPNCPDPYDHAGHTWDDTVACENGGDWLDSPGYFRCGLQFEPRWETIYGRLCP